MHHAPASAPITCSGCLTCLKCLALKKDHVLTSPSLLAPAPCLQVPWVWLTYPHSSPAVRLAAQVSSGLFPFVVMDAIERTLLVPAGGLDV